MMTVLEIIERSADYLVFRDEERLFLFLTEGAGLFPLRPAQCLEHGRLQDSFRDRLVETAAAIAVHEQAGRALLHRSTAGQRPAVSAVNLNLTDKCNLACVYCYAKGGDYERITHDMNIETIVAALEGAGTAIDRTREFRFEFFGGEPLLNKGTVQAVLDWQQEQEILPARVINRVSTSLTAVDDAVADALVEGNFILSVSIDGREETQNRQRPFKSGGGTYQAIIDNVRRLKERAPATVTVARMTAYYNAAQLVDDIETLRDLNIFDYCSIYSAAIEDEDGGTLYMSDGFCSSYLEFASRYGRYLADEMNIFKGCLELNRYLGHILFGTVALNHCRAGIGYFSLSPDGSVHPCHRLIGREDMALPGGLAKAADTPAQWQRTVLDREGCRDCAIRYFCGGGCKQTNLIATGSLLGRSEQNCRFSHLLVEAALLAAVRLGDTARARLQKSCQQLSDLFVLCGQNVARTDRMALRQLAETGLGSYLDSSASENAD